MDNAKKKKIEDERSQVVTQNGRENVGHDN